VLARLAVIERQLRLSERLTQAGRIDHEQLFFTHSGARSRTQDIPMRAGNGRFTVWRSVIASAI